MAQETSESKEKTGRRGWLGYLQLAGILAAIAVALYFAQAPSQVERHVIADMAQEAGVPAVTVIRPAPTERAVTIDLTGAVTLQGKARITSEVEGRVAWVSPDFRNGGSIPANEVFLRIDPAEYALRVEAAEAAVSEAEARVWLERAIGEESAEAFARDNPGAEASDWVRGLPSIAQAEAALTSAQAALKLAMLQLERTNISLPYDARVTATDIEVGEFVGPAEVVGREAALGSVYRAAAVQVRAPVEEKHLAYLAPAVGRSATVRTATGTFAAEVVRQSSIVAPKTRLARLYLRFAESHDMDSLPRPGSFAEVSIAGPTHQDVYVLPEAAMQDQGGVWIVEGGALKAVAPRVLGHADDGVVVEAFEAGDGVVVGALPRAREGLAVEASDAPSSG